MSELKIFWLVLSVAQFSKLSNFSYQTSTNNTAPTAGHPRQQAEILRPEYFWEKDWEARLYPCPSWNCFSLFLLDASCCFYRPFYFVYLCTYSLLFVYLLTGCYNCGGLLFWLKTKIKKLLFVPLNPFPDILDGYWPIIFMSCW